MKTLLLDVMGTLVYDPFHEVMPAFFGMTLAELIAAKHPRAWLDFEAGAVDEASFLKTFFRDGRSFDHVGLKRAMFSNYRFLDGVLPLLEELRDQGQSMHLASNYSSWYREIEDRLALSRYAPWTFMSCEWKLRKPDPAVFRGLVARLGIRPDEALFVDDSESNCAAASAEGLLVHRFVDVPTLRRELIEQGLIEG